MPSTSHKMVIHPNSKLLMIGDSITDCDRARPIGEGPNGALGNGYVSLVDGLIQATCPEMGIRVVNMGVSGNTVRDLKMRWQSDVLDIEPDWLSIMIGINDVWRHFDTWLWTEWQISPDKYASTLEELVADTLPLLKGLVLMTPYLIEPDRADAMRAMMDRYGDIVRFLAGKYQAILVDTQAAFDDVTRNLDPMALAGDRVHPSLIGHCVLARAYLQAIEFPW